MIASRIINQHVTRRRSKIIFRCQYWEWYGNGEPSEGNGRYKPKGASDFSIMVNGCNYNYLMYYKDELVKWFKEWLVKKNMSFSQKGKVYTMYELRFVEPEDSSWDVTADYNASVRSAEALNQVQDWPVEIKIKADV